MKAQSLHETKALDDDEDVVDEKQAEQQANLSGPITLNVGGTRYTTSLGALSRFPESVLCKMFAGAFSLKPESDGSYFIDRDGQAFRYILNYLRDGVLFTPTDSEWIEKQLLMEATYFQISPLIKLLNLQNIQRQSALSERQIEDVKSFIANVDGKHSREWQWRRLSSLSDLNGTILRGVGVDLKKVLIARTELFVVAIYFPDGSRNSNSKMVMCVIDHESSDIKATFVGVPIVCPKQSHTYFWQSIFEVEKKAQARLSDNIIIALCVPTDL